MSMRVLSNQLKSKLEGISDIQNVYDYPWLDFDGYPSATITPSGMESDYETQAENLRSYVFTIRLFLSVDEVNASTYQNKVSEGFRIIETLMDTVIDVFDKDETLTGISLPDGKQMISIIPVPSVINYFTDDKMLVAEIKISVNISFDTTS